MSGTRSYRAYLLSDGDHIQSVNVVDALDDASACLEANFLLRKSIHAAVEVWDKARFVWRGDRDEQIA
jgi:hypothetical protein